MFFGESLLFRLIAYLVKGPLPDGSAILISSTGFAGWVGFLVTMFNLLPIGQLDGGHICYALFGRAQQKLATAVLLGLLALSFFWVGWALWIMIGVLLRPGHPPTVMDEMPLGTGRKIVGLVSLGAFVLCFIPIPVSMA